MARLKGQKEISLSRPGKNHITAFCKALKERFQDKASNFGKEYLKLLVNEIMIVKDKVRLTGSYSSLAGALCNGSELGSLPGVPSSMLYWLPRLMPQSMLLWDGVKIEMNQTIKNNTCINDLPALPGI